MADEQKSKLRLAIAHVLFIDIVGYSKLRTNEQSAQMEKLREIVRGTEQYRTAEAEGKLLRLPTGDGGALAFRNNPEAPVLCAEEIAKALKSHPEIRVRMGKHGSRKAFIATASCATSKARSGRTKKRSGVCRTVLSCSSRWLIWNDGSGRLTLRKNIMRRLHN